MRNKLRPSHERGLRGRRSRRHRKLGEELLESRLCLAQTTGLFHHDVGTEDGYVLFAPNTSDTTYLMDKDANIVNTWTSNYTPGLISYLLPDGSLIRDAAAESGGQGGNGYIEAAGAGGLLEKFDWDGTKTWEYEYSSPTHLAHHDFEVLPNGNILLIAWELKSESEATQAGRDPNLPGAGYLYPDHIVEVQPDYQNGGGDIVWEWHIWDHLVQEFDATKDNWYGATGVDDHPELIDLNYVSDPLNGGGQREDWTHSNGIDYNAELDQIALSVREFSEFWIIDHSTTTAEAASHSGGNSGKGGDLLYRWGNPEAYDRGTAGDRVLYFQHDAKWVEDGLPGAENITVFNNGFGRPGTDYTTIEEIAPPVDVNGNYTLVAGQPYGPASTVWTYMAPIDDFSAIISGIQRLPNGNSLITYGVDGTFSEVTSSGTEVWRYVNPYVGGGTLGMEQAIPSLGLTEPGLDALLVNFTFRAIHYPVNYVPQLASTVAGRHIFYNESAYDGNNAAINANDANAIAPDKTALLPSDGQAQLANITNYTRGINGIIIDLSTGVDHSGLTLANVGNNFVFKIGANNMPANWAVAPAPSGLIMTPGGGVSGSDRVTITWADNIKDTWLQVGVLPTPQTGLAALPLTIDPDGPGAGAVVPVGDVFYFGNLVGETTSATPAGASFVRSVAADRGPILTNGTQFNVGIANVLDINKNNSITVAADGGPILSAGTSFLLRINIAPPSLAAALANDTGPGGIPNNDAITQDPQIDGTLTDAQPITSFLAGLNAGPVSTNVLPLVQPGGGFSISESLLQSIHGGTLADGTYTLHLRAENSMGLASTLDVPFSLKRSIAAPGLPDLTDASDSGVSDTDNITNDDTPTIDVLAEQGSTVTLFVDGSPVAQQTAGPVAQFTLDSLGDGTYSVTASAVDGAGNVSSVSAALSLTIQTQAPNVVLSTVVTFSDDLTPHVTVTAEGDLGLANGTQVILDVDINNDGDYDDAGELGRTLSTLYNGGSYFELTPALPATDPIDGPYLVQLRARVSDVAGNEGVSSESSLKIDTLGSTALYDYVNAVDPSFSWSQAYSSIGAGYTYYVLDMRSQTWHLGDVNDPYWDHWVKIVVPNGTIADTALLYVTGGDNGDSLPTSPNGDMVSLALATGAVTVELRIVPNEEVYFFAEPGTPYRDEDEIISYTFDQFVNNIGAPGNETWPLLLPMVKSAVAAMDATQAFVPTVTSGQSVNDFVVTGYSKRGWTTWLTGAVDTRVKAIIPGVIDLLNMDESMIHHYGFYDGAFSPQVGAYQDFDLIQNIAVEANQELGRIVDPYRYLFNSNLTNIPKLLINSTGDEFFVPDSGQYYLHDLPGTSYVRYIPNTGHSLDGRAGDSTLTFFDAYLNNRTLPEFTWTAEQDGSLHVQAVTTPTTVKLWQATNASARDFRKGYNPGITWTSTTLTDQGGGVFIGDVPVPATGATAFVVELTFPSAIPGNPYVFTTEVRVKNAVGYDLTPWPFYMPTNGGVPSVVTAASTTRADSTDTNENAIVSGLAMAITPQSLSTSTSRGPYVSASVEPAPLAIDDAVELMFAEISWLDDEPEFSDGQNDNDALDLAIIGWDESLAD